VARPLAAFEAVSERGSCTKKLRQRVRRRRHRAPNPAARWADPTILAGYARCGAASAWAAWASAAIGVVVGNGGLPQVWARPRKGMCGMASRRPGWRCAASGAALLAISTTILETRLMQGAWWREWRGPRARERRSPTVDVARPPRVVVARTRCFHSVGWFCFVAAVLCVKSPALRWPFWCGGAYPFCLSIDT
jgi:hypothetical protein